MKVLRLTDADLRAILSPGLQERLVKAGFRPGASSDTVAALCFPVHLDLAGFVEVSRDIDGGWTFTQHVDEVLHDRTEAVV